MTTSSGRLVICWHTRLCWVQDIFAFMDSTSTIPQERSMKREDVRRSTGAEGSARSGRGLRLQPKLRYLIVATLIKEAGYPDGPDPDALTPLAGNESGPAWDQPRVHDVWREWRRLADTYDPRDRGLYNATMTRANLYFDNSRKLVEALKVGDMTPAKGAADLRQATADQLASEAHECSALRRRLVRGKSTEPPEARTVVQRLGQPHVRQVVPGRQQQGTEQRQRRPAGLALCGRRDAD